MFKKFLMMIIFLFSAYSLNNAQSTNDSTRAQTSSIGLGPQLGWQKSSSADNGRIMLGIALRLKISNALGLEGSISYRSEEYANGALSVKTWPIMVSGLIYPIEYFYGLIGIGWYNTSFDYGDQKLSQTLSNNTQQNFGWHLGAGLEIPATDSINITGDVRYVFLNYDFGDLERVANSGDLISNFFVITVGASFRIHL